MGEETAKKKIKYPRAIFIIFVCEFCERFTYQNMKAILVLYFLNVLKYNDDTCTTLYHSFRIVCFFSTLLGGIIADSFLGKFKTIIYLCLLFTIGEAILSVGAMSILPLPHREISFIGLFLLATGTGGIKPCVSAFGAEQFTLPEQVFQLQKYFSIYLLNIEMGSLIASFLSPILRKDVHCFGENSCYPLAFGFPVILMIISLSIFAGCKNLYKIKKPEENVTVMFVKCIWSALRNKLLGKYSHKKKHWLEYASDDTYSRQQISDYCNVLNTLFIFIPAPIFWALIVQVGSRWTLQSINLDGRFWLGYYIKPDQLHLVSTITYLLFIPILDLYVYPILKFIGIRKPLQKIILGGFLCSIAFLMATYLEFQIQDISGKSLRNGYSQLRIFNSLDCKVVFGPSINNISEIEAFSVAEFLQIPVGIKKYEINFQIDSSSCPYKLNNCNAEIIVFDNQATSYFISENSNKTLSIHQINQIDDLKKDSDGYAKIKLFYSSSFKTTVNLELQNAVNFEVIQINLQNNSGTNDIFIPPNKYTLKTNKSLIPTLLDIDVNPAEIDVILLHQNISSEIVVKVINIIPPNKIHMVWQFPQFIVVTIADVIFYIQGLKFSFTEAPESMKSLLSAAWILQVAFGDIIVIIVNEAKLFHNKAYEFLFYSGIMVLDMIILIKLSLSYKYVNLIT